MPGRKTPLITDEYYHVFNRGIDRRPIFTVMKEYRRAFECIKYYQYASPPVKLSLFLTANSEHTLFLLKQLRSQPKQVVVVCYCLMPNHFHMLLKQAVDKGISKFMNDFQNSYSRYFNLRHDRYGSLFQNRFKAVHIETDAQLLHLSRYIHLNPYSSGIVSDLDRLPSYKWSSLYEYLNVIDGFCEKEVILNQFKRRSKKRIEDMKNIERRYRNFVYDRADYQKHLEKIKHLAID